MWGIGATLGPYVMGYALTGGKGWNAGYRYIGIMQIVLTAVLVCSLPLWVKRKEEGTGGAEAEAKALSIREVLKIRGAKEVMFCFFCYCALESTAGLWSSSYP